MFVCADCHSRMMCRVEHSTVSFGTCEVCREEGECHDHVASRPVTKAELAATSGWKSMQLRIYQCGPRLEYPRRKE